MFLFSKKTMIFVFVKNRSTHNGSFASLPGHEVSSSLPKAPAVGFHVKKKNRWKEGDGKKKCQVEMFFHFFKEKILPFWEWNFWWALGSGSCWFQKASWIHHDSDRRISQLKHNFSLRFEAEELRKDNVQKNIETHDVCIVCVSHDVGNYRPW